MPQFHRHVCGEGDALLLRLAVAIPVYNEERHVDRVLAQVRRHAPRGTAIVVVDDGSSDATPALLARHDVHLIRHAVNLGYGRALRDAFDWAVQEAFDWLITMDCDEQHEPAAIPRFVAAIARDDADVVSGSRYLVPMPPQGTVPPDRRLINARITAELRRHLGLPITDAFCGFKAHRVAALAEMRLDEDGYAFPLQFWVQVAALGLRVREVPVRLIYNDPNRSFGGMLDDPVRRLRHYRRVLHRELTRWGLASSPSRASRAACP